MERLKISSASISNGNKKEFSRQIYCKNWFSDRVFYIAIADAAFCPHADEVWTNSYGTKFSSFWQKKKLTILTKRWCHFERRFCSWNKCLRGYCTSYPMFCALSQNYQHLFEKFWTVLIYNLNQLGILKFQCHFWVHWTISYKMHNLFFKNCCWLFWDRAQHANFGGRCSTPLTLNY